jgi:hypothetical protein
METDIWHGFPSKTPSSLNRVIMRCAIWSILRRINEIGQKNREFISIKAQ